MLPLESVLTALRPFRKKCALAHSPSLAFHTSYIKAFTLHVMYPGFVQDITGLKYFLHNFLYIFYYYHSSPAFNTCHNVMSLAEVFNQESLNLLTGILVDNDKVCILWLISWSNFGSLSFTVEFLSGKFDLNLFFDFNILHWMCICSIHHVRMLELCNFNCCMLLIY